MFDGIWAVRRRANGCRKPKPPSASHKSPAVTGTVTLGHQTHSAPLPFRGYFVSRSRPALRASPRQFAGSTASSETPRASGARVCRTHYTRPPAPDAVIHPGSSPAN